MIVLDLIYINENTRLEELAEFCVGTAEQQAEVERAGNYVENKIFLDVDKNLFSDDEGQTFEFTDEFKFIVLNLFECYWEFKDIMPDIKAMKSKKVDDVSEQYRDLGDFKMFRGIPCDEDTIASILGYSMNYGVGNITVDLSDVNL